jgi:hypothetical protein
MQYAPKAQITSDYLAEEILTSAAEICPLVSRSQRPFLSSISFTHLRRMRRFSNAEPTGSSVLHESEQPLCAQLGRPERLARLR